MPTAPARRCNCGRTATAGGRCVACADRYEQRRGSAQARGYDRRWAKYVRWFKRQPEHCLCACGCGRATEHVDHIDAVEGPLDAKFWEPTNHQGLSALCHRRKSVRFDGALGQAPARDAAAREVLEAMRATARERHAALESRRGGGGSFF